MLLTCLCFSSAEKITNYNERTVVCLSFLVCSPITIFIDVALLPVYGIGYCSYKLFKKIKKNNIKKNNIKKNNINCMICLEKLNNETHVIKTNCEHLFHLRCFTRWDDINQSCACCRKKHPTIKIIE